MTIHSHADVRAMFVDEFVSVGATPFTALSGLAEALANLDPDWVSDVGLTTYDLAHGVSAVLDVVVAALEVGRPLDGIIRGVI